MQTTNTAEKLIGALGVIIATIGVFLLLVSLASTQANPAVALLLIAIGGVGIYISRKATR